MDKIILVDEFDNAIGTMEKMEAHTKGVLHRAFSVVLFNSAGEILLQKRSKEKYHSGGLWTNTCCSHPRPQDNIDEATRRRLMHEMGIDIQPEFAFKFMYKANLDHNLIEHEFDHVYTAIFDGTPAINTDEVEAWKFMNISDLLTDMSMFPSMYTPWFKLIVDHPSLKKKFSNL
jgi:isopentenyl-diphosphate Delta-isomerase